MMLWNGKLEIMGSSLSSIIDLFCNLGEVP